jgi:hypothetical protein
MYFVLGVSSRGSCWDVSGGRILTTKICVGRVGMELSEGRVHSGVRVHHVCTENADIMIWLPLGWIWSSKYQSNQARSRQFASRSNPLQDRLEA